MLARVEYQNAATGASAVISLQKRRWQYAVRLERERRLEAYELVQSVQEAEQVAHEYQHTLLAEYGMVRAAEDIWRTPNRGGQRQAKQPGSYPDVA